MNITVINSSIPNYDYGLNIVLQSVKEILIELGDNVNEIMLSHINIPPLQTDMPSGDFINIINEIKNSDGVIFAFNTHFSAPNSIMQNFIDYLNLPMCINLLQDKNCYILTTTKDSGEKESICYVSNVISYLGGYASITTGISKELVQNISMNLDDKVILEKQVEDYYRFVRQGRKFFPLKPFCPMEAVSSMTHQSNASNNYNFNQNTNQNANNVSNNIQNNIQQNEPINHFEQYNQPTQTQQQDFFEADKNNEKHIPVNKKIQNLTNSYVQNSKPNSNSNNSVNDIASLNKLTNSQTNVNNNQHTQGQDVYQGSQVQSQVQNKPVQQDNQQAGVISATRAEGYFQQDFSVNQSQQVVPQNKTVEQMTKALEHYYQGHLANGFSMDLFIQISGEESFEGTLKINGNSCTYITGQNNIADVTVASSTSVWKDILSGKISMQKAFMTGQVKVRGNFVLLSRFDNLFKI